MSDNKPNAKTALDDAYAFIDGMDPDSEAYTHALRNIKDLEQIQDAKRRRFCPSPDAVVGHPEGRADIPGRLEGSRIRRQDPHLRIKT